MIEQLQGCLDSLELGFIITELGDCRVVECPLCERDIHYRIFAIQKGDVVIFTGTSDEIYSFIEGADAVLHSRK